LAVLGLALEATITWYLEDGGMPKASPQVSWKEDSTCLANCLVIGECFRGRIRVEGSIGFMEEFRVFPKT